MIEGDARENTFLKEIQETKNAIVVMEGISMYLSTEEVQVLLKNINEHFEKVSVLMDCYTVFAAKASQYKNPINDVGVTKVYGIDNPEAVIVNTGSFSPSPIFTSTVSPPRFITTPWSESGIAVH